MFAVPGATAVTRPFATVATAVLSLAQVTLLSVASSGLTVAVSVSVPSTVRVVSVLLRVTPVTATLGVSMVKTNVTPLPMPIMSPLNDTLEALPVQVPPDQPAPEASAYLQDTSILVKFPSVVVNVPPPMKFLSLKSIMSAVIVTPSLVKEFPHVPVMSASFHVTVVDAAYAVPLIPGASANSSTSVSRMLHSFFRMCFIRCSSLPPPGRTAILYCVTLCERTQKGAARPKYGRTTPDFLLDRKRVQR